MRGAAGGMNEAGHFVRQSLPRGGRWFKSSFAPAADSRSISGRETSASDACLLVSSRLIVEAPPSVTAFGSALRLSRHLRTS